MRSRRTLLAVLGGVLAFAIVVGSAASLGTFTSDGLGAATTAVASCDSDGVSSSYTTTYSATAPVGYRVGTVTIAGIAAACDLKSMSITLTGDSNVSLGEQVVSSISVVAGATTVSFASSNVLAASVTGIHVVITG
ncbi:hypothetical protein BH20ACT16_BH20ACT16_09470 [soil metagenome]|jgi:hypothetical protein